MIDSYETPLKRVSEQVLERQTRAAEQAWSTGKISHGKDEFVMVVNHARQIVFASPKLVEIFGDEPFCGKRPGEFLKCIHAGDNRCGLTEFCRFCGAAKAIVDTQKTLHGVNGECVVQTSNNGLSVTYNFNVRTIPLEIQTERFILVLFDDVSEKKHRAALERIFFHDILNTASGLKAYLDLLKRQVSEAPERELVTRIGEIADALVEEIQSQKLLVSAENGTLNPSRQIIIADELVRSVVSQYEHLDLAADKTMRIAPFSESFSLISDEVILRRILGNMVKNAIEATEPGDTVTIKSGIKDGYSVFEVHNPGVIPEKAQTSIFTHFFSTKGPGRGLGTYSIKLLAEGYLGGNVSFSSDKRHGTTFAVAFPTNKTS